MPRADPWTEARPIEIVNSKDDPPDEVITISDVDSMYLKMYLPITSTYKLSEDFDRDIVITNLCKGLQKTTTEYRFLGGYLRADCKGNFVKRGADHPNITVHINHLEHTEFPSYHELEQREFPFSNLDEQHLPQSLNLLADPTTRPDEGFPTIVIQLNLIRGGLIIGAAFHHQCVGAKGIDVVMARWAANTRALFTGIPPPPFNPGCLNPKTLTSTTPLSPDRIPEVEAKIKVVKYVPVLPESQAQPLETAQTIFHFPTSSLVALKASTISREPGQWVSTYDCITAVMWRAMTRARLPRQGVSPDDASRRISIMHPVDVRSYTNPPIPEAFPGNSIGMASVESSVQRLLAADGLADAALAVRNSVNKWRSPEMLKDILDYIVSFPNRNGVRFTLNLSPELETAVTSWGVLTAYQTHDFGFGPLRALRLATSVFNGTIFVYPKRLKEDCPDEGTEVFVTLEKSDMERLRADEELLTWAQVRSC